MDPVTTSSGAPVTAPVTAPDTAPVTLVTGGSSGIGAATVRVLLAAGHRVVATGRDPARLDALVASLPDGARRRLLLVTGDAASDDDVRRTVEEAVRWGGRLDHVVASAGGTVAGDVLTGDPAQWPDMLLTNVLGPALLVHHAVPHLRASRGRIVLLGSVAGVRNTPGNLYSVSKWAVHALAENTRLLVTGDGVGVCVVAPGRVETPFWGERGAPAGPILAPDDVARTIAWVLAQPAGTDVNQVVVRPLGQV